MRYRKPTPKEEIAAWRALAWQINLHRTITMNEAAVIDCLKRMDAWVASHSTANGERKDSEVQQNVNEAFWKYIAKDETQGAKG
jgi:hypothetical protein